MSNDTGEAVRSANPETQRGITRRPVARRSHDACLVHIYPSGPNMGLRYPLGENIVLIGRGEDCAVSVPDHSVSRRHARIEQGPGGYYVYDLQSTNGTFVNDKPVAATQLEDGDYLRAGNCIYRFLAGGNVEADYHEEIYRLTIIDGLTEVHNKRYLLEFLEHELARSERHDRPLGLVLFDIDRFKLLNDRLGHLGGDYTLRELAACVKTQVRKVDLFARYGGEEFALVLPETTRDGAIDCAEQIRRLVEAHAFTYEDESFRLTVSVGVAWTAGGVALTPDKFIEQADAKLYAAKDAGRNRIAG
jgi:diguanylate cyclase (GGDEF)-like protein